MIHHQFECIHPFYDGNRRTDRILNILYLTKADILSSPIFYLSRFINQNKSEYYRLLQEVRDTSSWDSWLINNLFKHPYIKNEFVVEELNVHRNTARKYLESLVDLGLLVKHKIGKENYYLNKKLYGLLSK